jgi:excisionase family DNA binding protein
MSIRESLARVNHIPNRLRNKQDYGTLKRIHLFAKNYLTGQIKHQMFAHTLFLVLRKDTMNYRDGVVKETEFFTTAELADKLKMNVQVIARKIQAGEILAYKVGKDWRIPERAVFAWLEERSNKHVRYTSVVLESDAGHIAPEIKHQSVHSRRRYLLEFILAQFEVGKAYRIEDVNRVIARYDKDIESLRRELLTEGMMETSGNLFRRRMGYKLTG